MAARDVLPEIGSIGIFVVRIRSLVDLVIDVLYRRDVRGASKAKGRPFILLSCSDCRVFGYGRLSSPIFFEDMIRKIIVDDR